MTMILNDFIMFFAMIPWQVWLALGFLFNAVKWFAILWVFFLAVMHLKDADKNGVLATLDPRVQKAAYVVLAVGIIINLLVRVCFSWMVFGEIPPPFRYWGEWAVSAQVKRLCNEGDGWRQQRAFWWRDNVLKPFDLWGGHD